MPVVVGPGPRLRSPLPSDHVATLVSRDVEAVGAWHTLAGRTAWARARARAVALLADADRLAPMVELVGLSALPDRERMVLLAGRLLREAVLQQSALSTNDATCSVEKQAALLDMVLAIYDRCLDLVEHGLAASRVEESDLSDITRVRDEVGPEDAVGIEHRRDQTLVMLEKLGRAP